MIFSQECGIFQTSKKKLLIKTSFTVFNEILHCRSERDSVRASHALPVHWLLNADCLA